MKPPDDLAAARGQALLAEAIEAHGGAARWLSAHTITSAVQLRGAMPTVLFPGRQRVVLLIYGQALATRFLDTFREFPPRQKAASFTIDQAIESLSAFLAQD